MIIALTQNAREPNHQTVEFFSEEFYFDRVLKEARKEFLFGRL